MDAEIHREHDWRPISGWTGRYRCSICSAIGYKGIVIKESGRSDHYKTEIHPYLCSGRTDNLPCGKLATVAAKGGKRLCWDHGKSNAERRRK